MSNKLYGFKRGEIVTLTLILTMSFKVISRSIFFFFIKNILFFFNGTPYILLHIFIVYSESFPKHYNKTFFH